MSEPQFTLEDMVALETRISELDAEVARLRELNSNIIEERRAYERDLATERAAHEATKSKLAGQRTRAEHQEQIGDEFMRRAMAAERRVAELERELDTEKAARGQDIRSMSRTIEQINMDLERNKRLKHEAATDRDAALTALSSARELLTSVNDGSSYGEWCIRRNNWLRDHPEPATPAQSDSERRMRATMETERALSSRAPAATGAEPCDVCASVRSVVHGWGPGTDHDTAADALDTIAGIFEYAAEAVRAEKEPEP